MTDLNDATAGLGSRTWYEIGVDADAPFLIVPIGSCEQHGPHLPLDTDTRIATSLAEALTVLRPGLLVTPAIAISASGEHRGFPGTLSIGHAALELVLVELARSADWSTGMVFVNGHGGNLAPAEAAASTLRSEGRRVLNWWPRIVDGDAHAGRTETSLMLAISSSAVHLDLAVAGNTDRLAELMPSLRDGGVAAVSNNGVLGDPRGATVEEGDLLFAELLADLARRFDAWRA